MSSQTSTLSTSIADSSSARPRTTKRRLLGSLGIFLGVATAGVLAVAGANFWLNPLTYSRAQQQAAAAALADGRNLAIPDTNIDLRELRREHLRSMATTPDVVIFGGSRWQEASGVVAPGKRVYNAFVSSDHFEDMMAIAELLRSTNRMPETLILSARFSTFEYLDRRDSWWWKSFAPEYRVMAERLGVEPHPWTATLPFGKWWNLLSLDALFAKYTQRQTVPALWQVTDAPSDPVMDVISADGALHFSKRHLELYSTSYAEADAARLAKVHGAKRLRIDPNGVQQLGALLAYLKKSGVRVVLAQTPFHPIYYAAIAETAYFQDLMAVEHEINRVAAEAGALVVGSFDARKVGCTAADYRDFNHSRVECLSAIVAQIPDL